MSEMMPFEQDQYVEVDYPCEEPSFEASVAALVELTRQMLKTAPNADLEAAVDNVAEYLEQEDDPRKMGWVGSDGRP